MITIPETTKTRSSGNPKEVYIEMGNTVFQMAISHSTANRMMTILKTMTVLAFVVLLCSCSDKSSGDNHGSEPRMWDRQLLSDDGRQPSIAVSSDGTVNIVYLGTLDSEFGVVWQTAGGTPELIEATSEVLGSPRVARDASGNVHVIWGTDSTVFYAVRSGSGWTVETIANGRFRPDISVTSGGVPHVAFVAEETGDDMVYHATYDGENWQITPVNGTYWHEETEVGIVLGADDLPIVVAPGSNHEGLWVAESDAEGDWSVTNLAPDRILTGPLDVAVGEKGLAAAFKDVSYTVVAWRPAGGDEWSVEEAFHHDDYSQAISLAVGANGPMVVSDVDAQFPMASPNGLAFLERTSDGWSPQLLAGRTVTVGGHAMAVDLEGKPVLAIVWKSGLSYMTVIGHYPEDWLQQCEAAAAEMCEVACLCGVDGEDCCWGIEGGSICTGSSACTGHATDTLCGDPTVTPEQLGLCRNELASLTCGAEGPLDLSGACESLY